MEEGAIRKYFSNELKQDVEGSVAVAALKTLLQFIEFDQSGTVAELVQNLKIAIKTLTLAENATASVNSVSELCLRFITLTSLDHQEDFKECKNALLARGRIFLERVRSSKGEIAKIVHPFIQDGTVVLTHSRSRVVYHTLCEASKWKRFQVFVTESQPDQSGREMHAWLRKRGIPCTVILDAAVGYIMEKVDLVLLGAEGVVASGGIINKIGSFNVAVCAKAMNKPVYVLAERFKFLRMYPLNQGDVPNEFKYPSGKLCSEDSLKEEHPLIDYTPPAYLTLLFTEVGSLTPTAVSDELINLYL